MVENLARNRQMKTVSMFLSKNYFKYYIIKQLLLDSSFVSSQELCRSRRVFSIRLGR